MIPLVQEHSEFAIEAETPGMTDITARTADWLRGFVARDGLLTVFLRHSSASLTIQDHSGTRLRGEVSDALARLAVDGSADSSDAETGTDTPAHIKSMLSSVSLSIPVFNGAMALGPGQSIVLIEHRKRLGSRTVVFHFVGSRH